MAGEVERLSGKLGLDTTDFKAAIAAANREMRVLESGFKASAAALNDWTKDATGLEARTKSLTSQIDIQKLKVAALAAEHQRLAQENGENSRAAQDAEIKLNKETESLNRMQTQLNTTEQSLQQMQEGEDQAGNSAQEMGSDVQTAAETIDGAEVIMGGFTAALGLAVAAVAALEAAAVAAVVGISNLVFSASDAGSAIQDMSDQTGISTTRLQELGFIGNQVGTSLDTITGAQAKLIRSMSTANGAVDDYNQKLIEAQKQGKNMQKVQDDLDQHLNPVLEAFNTLGVTVRDNNGQLRDNQAVFSDVINALGKVQNPAERDALAMQIFGKSAQELNPLIKLGAQGMADMAQQAHDLGAVMSEESVASLDQFNDTMSSVQDGLKGTLGTLATAFLPLFQKLADVFLSDINPAIQKFISGAVERIQPLMEAAAQGVDSIIESFQNFDGDFIGAISDILYKLGFNLENLFGVKGANNFFSVLGDGFSNIATLLKGFLIDTIIPFFTAHASEIVSGATSIVSVIIKIITAVVQFSIFWTRVWFAVHDVINSVWAFLQPIFDLLFASLSVVLPNALQRLSRFWQVVLLPAIQNVWKWMITVLFPFIQRLVIFLVTTFVATLRNLAIVWQNVLLPAIRIVWNFMQNSLFPLIQAIANFIEAVFNVVLRVLAGIWQNFLLPAIQSVWSFLANNVFPIFQTIGNYISSTFTPIITTLSNWISEHLTPAFQGISDAIAKVIDWLTQMADKLNTLQLPSWLTPGSPTPLELGLVGINQAMRELNQQLPQLARNLQLNPSFAGIGGSSVDNSTSNRITVIGNVNVNGNTTPDSLASQLVNKGRRH